MTADQATTTATDRTLDESERLPEEARSGSPYTLAAAWAGILLAPGTIITGMVASGGSAGPGFTIGFTGLALGIVIGTVCVALVSIWGPRTGLAQMPLGRLAFGALNVVPQVFLVASLVAYNALNDLFGVDALASSLGISFLLALGVSEETARIDSEGIEHHVSEETLRAMARFLARKVL